MDYGTYCNPKPSETPGVSKSSTTQCTNVSVKSATYTHHTILPSTGLYRSVRSHSIAENMCRRPMHCALLVVVTTIIARMHAVKEVVDLTENNWQLMLKNEWMVEFYAPWCPACQALAPKWRDFATSADDIGITVARVDVTTSPGLSGSFMLSALPTIFHVLNGEFRQYKGVRDKNTFISFIGEKEWKSVVPLFSWPSPNSNSI